MANEKQIDNLVELLDGYAEKRRSPPERKRTEQRNSAGRSAASGKVSAADHPCKRLCSKLHQADQGTAG